MFTIQIFSWKKNCDEMFDDDDDENYKYWCHDWQIHFFFVNVAHHHHHHYHMMQTHQKYSVNTENMYTHTHTKKMIFIHLYWIYYYKHRQALLNQMIIEIKYILSMKFILYLFLYSFFIVTFDIFFYHCE